MMKRRALKLLLFLLAGAIINVAVAWGFALRYKTPVDRWTRDDHAEVSWWLENRIENFVAQPRVIAISTGVGFETVVMKSDSMRVNPSASLNFEARRYRFGWPLLCLERSRWWDNDKYQAFYFHQMTMWRAQTRNHYVPLRPLWPGFAINTIFYAAVFWVLIAAPGAIRRRIRIKRGKCAACGYSLQERVSDKCPECGAAA
jgi:hypothetical protein